MAILSEFGDLQHQVVQFGNNQRGIDILAIMMDGAFHGWRWRPKAHVPKNLEEYKCRRFRK